MRQTPLRSHQIQAKPQVSVWNGHCRWENAFPALGTFPGGNGGPWNDCAPLAVPAASGFPLLRVTPVGVFLRLAGIWTGHSTALCPCSQC